MEQSPCETKDARLVKKHPMFMKAVSTLPCSQESDNDRRETNLPRTIKLTSSLRSTATEAPTYDQISQLVLWIKVF